MGVSIYSITPSAAWTDDRLSHLQCRLLGYLGTYLHSEAEHWPSQQDLADLFGVTRKTISGAVRALAEYGYLHVENRFREDGGQDANRYAVVLTPTTEKEAVQ